MHGHPLPLSCHTMGNVESIIKGVIFAVFMTIVLFILCACFWSIMCCAVICPIRDKHKREKTLQEGAYQVQQMTAPSGYSSQYDLQRAVDELNHQEAVRQQERRGAFVGRALQTAVAPETLATRFV